ncbi:MAG: GNAT family N-acetyltransferase [Anaerolineales bacterium]|nr:GNAT family N-acetyltransferase [Anaerolineales bacterium]
MKIIEVQTPAEMEQINELFREYYKFLAREHGLDISYQGIEDELANLPGKYATPKGRLILAIEANHAVGCAALRPIDEQICELKRMYVLPQYREQGVGRTLAQTLIEDARQIGYHLMRLDTGNFLTSAIKLYESLGFKQIEPYSEVPEEIHKIAIFMELDLGSSH